jgi:hypothetical protein
MSRNQSNRLHPGDPPPDIYGSAGCRVPNSSQAKSEKYEPGASELRYAGLRNILSVVKQLPQKASREAR